MRRSGWWWAVLCVVWWGAARGAGDWTDCGQIAACACKWTSGKKSATCPSAALHTLPALSPDIQVLDLRDNFLQSLGRDAFAAAGLLNLQRLNLRATRLRTLHADAFRELRILVELDLADNELTEIPRGTFRGNERLRLLVLSGNPLASLPRDQLPALPRLRTLELAGCRLRSVHSDALSPARLPLLDSVDLRRNLLAHLRVRSLADLPALKTLALSGNPWRCDCRLRRFRDWYLAGNLGTEELTCAEPTARAGARWRDVNASDMVCAPEATPSTKVLRAEPGTDVRFGCFVSGDPRPSVSWSLEGRDVDNETTEVLMEEGPVETSEEELEGRWVNVSIVNATGGAAGEWTCAARSAAGSARATVALLLPRVRTATARSPPDYPPAAGVLAGSLVALCALGALSACACWHARHRRVPASRSFSDQEKKLLETSLAVSGDRSSGDLGSYELPTRPSFAAEPSEPVHISIEGGGFPPPPAEFAMPYGNIYISVSVPEECLDLLGSVGGATLPRRARACCAVPAYDNMGPRVTAGGSSTWSLPGSNAVPPPPPPPIVVVAPPPPEFVSL